MTSLLDLISQNQPRFQTQKALLVIGLQNDFIQPDGRLPVDLSTDFLENIENLVPGFRERYNNIIWVQTLYEADREAGVNGIGDGSAAAGAESSDDDEAETSPVPAAKAAPPSTPSRSARHKQRAMDLLKKVSTRRHSQSVPVKAAPSPAPEPTPEPAPQTPQNDDELFLQRTTKRAPACLPNTSGAEFPAWIKESRGPRDVLLKTTHYSAFEGTSLLMMLRANLITEVFICGCITNVSVLATVMDAARHGITINLVTDCLGYRKKNRHDDALKRMVDFLDASLISTDEILRGKTAETAQSSAGGGSQGTDDALEAQLGKLQLADSAPTSACASQKSSARASLVAPANGRPRRLSDGSHAESRLTVDTNLSNEQFGEMLAQGAKVPNGNDNDAPSPSKKKTMKVKTNFRMRARPETLKGERDGCEMSKEGKNSDHKEKEKPEADVQAGAASQPTQPKDEKLESPVRPATLAKAESSDNMKKTTSSRKLSLKSSTSQPSLSETKEVKPQKSLMRLALSRRSKSELGKTATIQPSSPSPGVESPSKTGLKTDPVLALNSVQNSQPKAPIPASPSSNTTITKKNDKLQSLATFPTLGPGDHIGTGDSEIIHNFFPSSMQHPSDKSAPLSDLIFTQLYNEVCWQKMHHQTGEVPRLVCCQGEFGADGSMPVYRHPSDQVLPLLHFSPKVQVIRKRAEKLVGHPLNHVLIQLYRDGKDYISEHSDKTLDIVRGSKIVNVSFGAQRTMRVRTKKPQSQKADDKTPQEQSVQAQRTTQRVALPHNSLFILGPTTNAKFLHSIQPDKRLASERSPAELAYSGMRISLTFRHIGTFLDASNSAIWGQGATAKDQRSASEVVNNDPDETEALIRAFGAENHDPDFSWDEQYGDGFDVLHFREAPVDKPILFASYNGVETKAVQIMLAKLKIEYECVEPPVTSKEAEKYEVNRQVRFRDADTSHSEISIAVPILLYLDRYYTLDSSERGRPCAAASMDILILVNGLVKAWCNRSVPTYEAEFVALLESLEEKLQFVVDEIGTGIAYFGGRRFSVGDCLAWAAVDAIVGEWEDWSEERFPCLSAYYGVLWRKGTWGKELRSALHEVKRRVGREEEKGRRGEGEERQENGSEE